jgi:hypothetical protein
MSLPAEQSNGAEGPSGGPKTAEGKEVARWNATRHGIRSPAPVVPGVEKSEDWEEYRDGMLEDLAPLGSLELALAERVTLLSWRLHRVTRYETETIEGDIHDRDRFLSAIRHKRFLTQGVSGDSRGCHAR